MTLDELIKARVKLYETYIKEYKRVSLEFLNTNKHFNCGDIIQDHIGKGKITKIIPNISISNTKSKPNLYYDVIELKKDGNPKKNNATRTIYSDNIITDFS